jgi:hypothetical protein
MTEYDLVWTRMGLTSAERRGADTVLAIYTGQTDLRELLVIHAEQTGVPVQAGLDSYLQAQEAFGVRYCQADDPDMEDADTFGATVFLSRSGIERILQETGLLPAGAENLVTKLIEKSYLMTHEDYCGYGSTCAEKEGEQHGIPLCNDHDPKSGFYTIDFGIMAMAML